MRVLALLLVAGVAVAAPYPLTPPRVYRGAYLEAVAMPIGGIGTGTIWLDGQGRLAVWQVFNNFGEPRIPGSFFALRARAEGGEAVTRVLQAAAEPGLTPIQSLTYEGGYPIARLDFADATLPVKVRLEATNPLVPLDTANSSIPCVLFRFTVTNPGSAPAQVDLLGSLQNAVGYLGGEVKGVKSAGYGGNRNRLVRGKGLTAIAMDRPDVAAPPGNFRVGQVGGTFTGDPAVCWQDWGRGANAELANLALEGTGGLLITGLNAADLARAADRVRKFASAVASTIVFADFEGDSYAGWTVTGEGFGDRPAGGALPQQQPVTGFQGLGLLNTFLGHDGPQGTMTSRPFTIEREFISFLIGGGNHPGETCLNLVVDGKVVRTATGKDRELLEPVSWEVRELLGRQATLEIVDRHSGGWGHVNVDQIAFCDVPVLSPTGPLERIVTGLGLTEVAPEERKLPSEVSLRLGGATWEVDTAVSLPGFSPTTQGCEVLAKLPSGEPLVLRKTVGKCRVLLCMGSPPRPWTDKLMRLAAGRPLQGDEVMVPEHNAIGTMALTAFAEGGQAANWTSPETLAGGAMAAPFREAISPPGETVNGLLSVPLRLAPGEARTVTFAITWRFPYVDRFGHLGNLYCTRWPDALAVARDLAARHEGLWQQTKLYHETVYQSNLPEEFLDAMTSQSVITRGPTCFWAADGYFGGYEGSYGCCPLNCTHVWNYAQTHARLFPEIGRNMRVSDFVTYLHPSGETSHRQYAVTGAFIDGHCAGIEGAYREYQLSGDMAFLNRVWPGVRKATDWMIETFDADRDGVPSGQQWNTYDCAVSGANTFIGSQYLSALAAAERMAEVMGDRDSPKRWRKVRLAGQRNQDAKLWNGQYYVQTPGDPPAQDYNAGCHSDQLLGQWWAHQLGLGYLYPQRKVRRAMQSVWRYNYRDTFGGFAQSPRRYVPDDEGGLLMCTWPEGGRPGSFTIYSDEVWTGIEYATAGLMVAEGLWDEARQVVKMARSRYDGRLRADLNSGPGGNPFNELECGKFYARAMSSWGLLPLSQGQVVEGPRGILGFNPRWQPEDHRSFFTAPEGWGLFVQQRGERQQTGRIEVRWGTLKLRELVFEAPPGTRDLVARVTAAGQPVDTRTRQVRDEVRVALDKPVTVTAGQDLVVTLGWR